MQWGSHIHCMSYLLPCSVMSCTIRGAVVIICINVYFPTRLWSLWRQGCCLTHPRIYNASDPQCLLYWTTFECSCPSFSIFLSQCSWQGCSSAISVGAVDSGLMFPVWLHLFSTYPRDSIVFIEPRNKDRKATLQLFPLPYG